MSYEDEPTAPTDPKGPERTIGKVSFDSAWVTEPRTKERIEGAPNEDYVLVDNELGVFGVFDGLGSKPHAEIAAKAASDTIQRFFREQVTAPRTLDEITVSMRDAFRAGHRVVSDNYPLGGATTALVAKYYSIDSVGYWAIGNAGDARSFEYNPGQPSTYQTLTKVQDTNIFGKRQITNFFGMSPDEESPKSSDQIVIIPAYPKQRLILTTDGITGNSTEDSLTVEQYVASFGAVTPQEVADALITASIKDDDKSVVVVDLVQS